MLGRLRTTAWRDKEELFTQTFKIRTFGSSAEALIRSLDIAYLSQCSSWKELLSGVFVAWCLLCCSMFVGVELLVSLLVFSSKKMSLITEPPSPHQMTMRFAFLIYNVNSKHWLSHL